jgi:hypothetical protein
LTIEMILSHFGHKLATTLEGHDSQLSQLLCHASTINYDCLEGRGSLSSGPERKSLLAIRANHITIGTSDTSDKTTPIVPTVGGINVNTPADNPAYPVVLLNRWWGLRSITADTVRMARALRT